MYYLDFLNQNSYFPEHLPSQHLLAQSDSRNTRTQPAISCSKVTIETIEQGGKDTIGVVLVSLLLTLNIFHTLP